MDNYRIKGVNRKKRKREKDRMPVNGKSLFVIEETKKKRRDEILRKRRKRKEQERDENS